MSNDVWKDLFYPGSGSEGLTRGAKEKLGLPSGESKTEDGSEFRKHFEVAIALRIKSKMLRKISRKLKSYGPNLEATSLVVGIPVDVIDDVVTGKIEKFDTDLLITLATRLNLDISIAIEDKQDKENV